MRLALGNMVDGTGGLSATKCCNTIRLTVTGVAVMLAVIWFATAPAMDIRPHQSWAERGIHREVAESSDSASPIAALSADEIVLSVQAIAGAIADHSRSVLSEGRSAQLMDNNDLLNRLSSVQRTAQLVVDEDGREPTVVSSRGTALFAALIDAANGAARLAARSGLPPDDRQALGQLEGWLRTKSTELGAALIPIPNVTSIDVSTPKRRLAMAALDLVRATRADESLIGSRPHISLVAGIDTVERAAQSFLLGSERDPTTAQTRLVALWTAILITDRVATNIAGRDSESEQTRTSSADLAGSLQQIATGLGVKGPSPEERARNAAQWSWWEDVPKIERLE